MRSLTNLVGTTASNSNTLYPMSFTTLSQNNTAQNVALGQMLVNNDYRYLLQKFFDNERTHTDLTIGAMSLTLTAPLAVGATTATLNAVWTYPTVSQLVNFSGGDNLTVFFTNGSATITWQTGLQNTATTAINTVGVQYYPLPATISKIKDDTVNVGQLKYTTVWVQSRADWDKINSLPYTSNIPNYAYIWDGTLGLWPIPSTTGNVITFNYKTRVADLSFADYTTGTISTASAGSSQITGTGTTWNTVGGYPLNANIGYYNLMFRIDPPFGDGIWYKILRFNSNTTLTLATPLINAPNISGSVTYTIAQIPILQEDFHDMLVYRPLMTYYSTIVPDPNRFKMFEQLYNEKYKMLEDYASNKQENVDLGGNLNFSNPNLYRLYP